MRLISTPLLLSAHADAFECVSADGRFLVGVGVGKFVSAGTDVGLSPEALQLLSTLVDRSIHENLAGTLRFVSVDRPELAVGCAVTTLLRTHDGDLVFFLAADHASAEAMRDALRALWSASHTRAAPGDHPGFG